MVAWIGTHRDALMLGAAVLAGLILLIADVSLLGLLVLALVTAAVELVLFRVGTGAGRSPTEAVEREHRRTPNDGRRVGRQAK